MVLTSGLGTVDISWKMDFWEKFSGRIFEILDGSSRTEGAANQMPLDFFVEECVRACLLIVQCMHRLASL